MTPADAIVRREWVAKQRELTKPGDFITCDAGPVQLAVPPPTDLASIRKRLDALAAEIARR